MCRLDPRGTSSQSFVPLLFTPAQLCFCGTDFDLIRGTTLLEQSFQGTETNVADVLLFDSFAVYLRAFLRLEI